MGTIKDAPKTKTKRLPAAEVHRLRREAFRKEEEHHYRNEFVRDASMLFARDLAMTAKEATARAELLMGELEARGRFSELDAPRPPFPGRESRRNPSPKRKKTKKART